MFAQAVSIEWAGGVVWLAGVAVASFLVTWVITDRIGIGRAVYVGVLAAVTGGLAVGYQLWSGSAGDFWTNQWPWGILGALVAGGALAAAARRLPIATHAHPDATGARFLWEAAIYGSAEGLLLSVLPVVITWQALTALGWGGVAAGAAALAASAIVIVVHHLGYAEFRSRRMVFALVGCLPLSLAVLLTGSAVAAIGGHIILHAAMIRRGVELPPQAAAPRVLSSDQRRNFVGESLVAH